MHLTNPIKYFFRRPNPSRTRAELIAHLHRELHQATLELHATHSRVEDYRADAKALRSKACIAAQQAELEAGNASVLVERIHRIGKSLQDVDKEPAPVPHIPVLFPAVRGDDE